MANPIYNVLQAKSAVATSSSNMSGFLPKLAIDGSGSTLSNPSRWVSANSTAGEWLQVDIGRLAVINKFVLYTGNSADNVINNGNSIQNGDFQIRQNGQWLTVGSFRNNNVMNPKIEVKLDKGYLTDAIRLYFPIAEGQYRVFELEAYGRILGKAAKGLTSKNLLPSFTDSLWNYTRPIVSISPRKVVLDLDQSRTNEYIIPAKPNTTYTLSGKTDGRVYIVQRVGNNDKVGTGYSNWNTFSRTITTGSDVNGLRVSMTADGAGIFTYEDVMLNEGANAAPYERYRPLPKAANFAGVKKNLLNINNYTLTGVNSAILNETSDFIHAKTQTNAGGFIFPVGNLKPNTSYTISADVELLKTVDDYVNFRVFNRTKGTYVNSMVGNNVTALNTKTKIVGTFSTGAISPSDNIEVWITQTWMNGTADAMEFKVYKNSAQLEEGTVATPFEKYKGINKAATKLPKKNLIDFSTIVLRSGTNGYTIEGNKITFDSTKQDYAGINFVTPDIWASGKTITLSCIDRSAGATPMLAYYPAGSQSLSYIGLSGGQYSKVINVPAGATGLRFYIQNDAGTRGDFWVTGLQVEVGSVVTPYEKFKLGAKAAVLTRPKKNFIPPFSNWNKSGAYTINSDYKITGVFTSGTISSCDYTVTLEVGKTYTLSGSITPTSGRIRVGKKSDNSLIGVVGANGTPTLTFTATERNYIVSIDNNYGTPVYGGTLVFENIQLEEGSVKTSFTPQKNRAKDARY